MLTSREKSTENRITCKITMNKKKCNSRNSKRNTTVCVRKGKIQHYYYYRTVINLCSDYEKVIFLYRYIISVIIIIYSSRTFLILHSADPIHNALMCICLHVLLIFYKQTKKIFIIR